MVPLFATMSHSRVWRTFPFRGSKELRWSAVDAQKDELRCRPRSILFLYGAVASKKVETSLMNMLGLRTTSLLRGLLLAYLSSYTQAERCPPLFGDFECPMGFTCKVGSCKDAMDHPPPEDCAKVSVSVRYHLYNRTGPVNWKGSQYSYSYLSSAKLALDREKHFLATQKLLDVHSRCALSTKRHKKFR